MSPIATALLGLLASKARQSGARGNIPGGGQPAPAGGARRGAPVPPGGTTGTDNPGGGGLAGILGGLLGGGAGGGARSSAAAGSVLSSGLGNLIKDLQGSGQGEVARSWVGTGPNKDIAPKSLEAAVGTETLDALARQTGMERDDLLAALSKQLPGFVDQLTPKGRLPTGKEAQHLV